MRLFESIVEQAAQADGEVRIGAITWYQGNPSMPDAAAAERGLVRVHGPQDRTSSLPREECSRERGCSQTFSRDPEVGVHGAAGGSNLAEPRHPLPEVSSAAAG